MEFDVEDIEELELDLLILNTNNSNPIQINQSKIAINEAPSSNPSDGKFKINNNII